MSYEKIDLENFISSKKDFTNFDVKEFFQDMYDAYLEVLDYQEKILSGSKKPINKIIEKLDKYSSIGYNIDYFDKSHQVTNLLYMEIISLIYKFHLRLAYNSIILLDKDKRIGDIYELLYNVTDSVHFKSQFQLNIKSISQDRVVNISLLNQIFTQVLSNCNFPEETFSYIGNDITSFLFFKSDIQNDDINIYSIGFINLLKHNILALKEKNLLPVLVKSDSGLDKKYLGNTYSVRSCKNFLQQVNEKLSSSSDILTLLKSTDKNLNKITEYFLAFAKKNIGNDHNFEQMLSLNLENLILGFISNYSDKGVYDAAKTYVKDNDIKLKEVANIIESYTITMSFIFVLYKELSEYYSENINSMSQEHQDLIKELLEFCKDLEFQKLLFQKIRENKNVNFEDIISYILNFNIIENIKAKSVNFAKQLVRICIKDSLSDLDIISNDDFNTESIVKDFLTDNEITLENLLGISINDLRSILGAKMGNIDEKFQKILQLNKYLSEAINFLPRDKNLSIREFLDKYNIKDEDLVSLENSQINNIKNVNLSALELKHLGLVHNLQYNKNIYRLYAIMAGNYQFYNMGNFFTWDSARIKEVINHTLKIINTRILDLQKKENKTGEDEKWEKELSLSLKFVDSIDLFKQAISIRGKLEKITESINLSQIFISAYQLSRKPSTAHYNAYISSIYENLKNDKEVNSYQIRTLRNSGSSNGSMSRRRASSYRKSIANLDDLLDGPSRTNSVYEKKEENKANNENCNLEMKVTTNSSEVSKDGKKKSKLKKKLERIFSKPKTDKTASEEDLSYIKYNRSASMPDIFNPLDYVPEISKKSENLSLEGKNTSMQGLIENNLFETGKTIRYSIASDVSVSDNLAPDNEAKINPKRRGSGVLRIHGFHTKNSSDAFSKNSTRRRGSDVTTLSNSHRRSHSSFHRRSTDQRSTPSSSVTSKVSSNYSTISKSKSGKHHPDENRRKNSISSVLAEKLNKEAKDESFTIANLQAPSKLAVDSMGNATLARNFAEYNKYSDRGGRK